MGYKSDLNRYKNKLRRLKRECPTFELIKEHKNWNMFFNLCKWTKTCPYPQEEILEAHIMGDWGASFLLENCEWKAKSNGSS